MTLPDPEHNVTLQQLRQLQSTANEELTVVVIDMINQLHQQIRASKYDRNTILISTEYRDCRGRGVLGEKFKKTDGPFFRTLECTLASLHVERQAYHGGTFVGNHVHKLVQVKCCILYMYHTQ